MHRCLSILFLVLLTASCGGEGGSLNLEGVSPAEARSGDIVTLSGAGLEAGDTVCFIPKALETQEVCYVPAIGEVPEGVEAGSALQVVVPNLSVGGYIVKVARQDNFSEGHDLLIIPWPVVPEDPDTLTDPPGGPPATPGTTVPEGGDVTPPSPDSGDAPPPPPSPPSGCSEPELELRDDPSFGIKKVRAKFDGLQNVYVYGNLLGNVALPPGGSVETIDLFVDQTGLPVSGTTGTRCQEAAGNCDGYHAADFSALYVLRRDLSQGGASNYEDFFLRLTQREIRLKLVGQCPADGSLKSHTLVIRAGVPRLDRCDVSLSSERPEINVVASVSNAVGFSIVGCEDGTATPPVTVRSGLGNGTYHCPLRAKKTQIGCVVFGVGNQFIGKTYEVELGTPLITLQSMTYVTDGDSGFGAWSNYAGDCESPYEDYECNFPGDLTLRWSVRRPHRIREILAGLKNQPALGAWDGYVPWVQSVSLVSYPSDYPLADCWQQDDLCIMREIPPIQSQSLFRSSGIMKAGGKGSTAYEVTGTGTLEGTAQVHRDYDHTRWQVQAMDYADDNLLRGYNSPALSLPFVPVFEIESSKPELRNQCEGEEYDSEDGCCAICACGDDWDVRWDFSFNARFKVRHVNFIRTDCGSYDNRIDDWTITDGFFGEFENNSDGVINEDDIDRTRDFKNYVQESVTFMGHAEGWDEGYGAEWVHYCTFYAESYNGGRAYLKWPNGDLANDWGFGTNWQKIEWSCDRMGR